MKESSFFRLSLKDFGKGLIIATGGALVGFANTALQTDTLFPVDLKQIGVIALGAVFVYLSKNLFTNSEGKILKKEKK